MTRFRIRKSPNINDMYWLEKKTWYGSWEFISWGIDILKLEETMKYHKDGNPGMVVKEYD